MKTLTALALLYAIFSGSMAHADIYCNGNIITEGSSYSDVRESCGTPTAESGTVFGRDSSTYQNKDSSGMSVKIIYGTDGNVQRIEETKHW